MKVTLLVFISCKRQPFGIDSRKGGGVGWRGIERIGNAKYRVNYVDKWTAKTKTSIGLEAVIFAE